jgi:hypothetical protein
VRDRFPCLTSRGRRFDDQRVSAELLQQEQGILAQGKLIVVGRFQDTNGDGIADVRSLFLNRYVMGPHRGHQPHRIQPKLQARWLIQIGLTPSSARSAETRAGHS